MLSQMKRRTYTKRKRAENEAQTRQRIVEATVALHEELGPRETSISAIAERAGVQRLTVYRHFEDDFELFQACTGHWLERHPPPDIDAVEGETPEVRTEGALLALYRYYRANERMWKVAMRDLEMVPALQEALKGFQDYLDRARDSLLAGWGVKGASRRKLRACLGHLLGFPTWESLMRQGLHDPEMSRLGTGWARACVSAGAQRAPRK